MFDSNQIAKVVDLQQRTYKLLKWLSTAVERGFIRFQKAHDYATEAEAAVDWLNEHHLNIPEECRPERRAPAELREFANMLSSYLLTSFELVDDPGIRMRSECGCYCPMCAQLSGASQLRLKNPTKSDRRRARKVKEHYVMQLALDCKMPISSDQAAEIIDDRELRESVSLAAYGNQLIRRARGHVEGPAVLALWREFAWLPDGSPRRDYVLKAQEIIESEGGIVRRIKAAHPAA